MDNLFSYGLLTVSTILFSFMFFFQDIFRKQYGGDITATFVLNIGSRLFALLVLLLINRFQFQATAFSLIMAVISAANYLCFSFCSLKALGKINLSLYTIFSMLGGMTLPFITGILFHGESFTLGKAICFVLITVSLFLTAQKDNRRSEKIYFAGVFTFNGLSSVITKAYQALPFEKVSSTNYTIGVAFFTLVISAVALLFIKERPRKPTLASIAAMAGNGVVGNIASLLLLIALTTLPASAQYPFITGGTMIVSTVISLFTKNKPRPREIIAIVVAFIGIMLLLLIPEMTIFTIN